MSPAQPQALGLPAELDAPARPRATAAAPPTAAPSRGDRLRAWWDAVLARRDRLLASERFRAWAAGFPLTRFIALRRARRLFDLLSGFVYSQVLLSLVRLDWFETLARAPLRPEELAEQSGIDVDAARRLVEAAESLGLLERRGGGRYGLGPLGAPVVGNAAVTAMIEHNTLLYDDLRDPVALLRGEVDTGLSAYWPYARAHAPAPASPQQVRRYSALMAASVPLVAGEVLDAYRVDRHRHLLDIGGGEGAFLLAAHARAPALRLTLLDLPPVAERAGERLRAAGLGALASAHGGDFRVDPIPEGADLVTLLRVLHDHDDATVLHLLLRIRATLPDDGALLVAEPLAGLAGAPRVGSAYFGLYLLAMGSGRPRSAAEYLALLEQAGFSRRRVLHARTPVQTGILLARP